MLWTRVILSVQIVLALAALGLYGVAVRTPSPSSPADSFFVVPPGGLGTVCALLLVTGAGGLVASYARRAWPRRAAYVALLVPVVFELGNVGGGGDRVSGMAYGPAALHTMLTLLTWAYRVAGVAALLALAAAVALIVRDVRDVRAGSYPQRGDPGARRPAAPD